MEAKPKKQRISSVGINSYIRSNSRYSFGKIKISKKNRDLIENVARHIEREILWKPLIESCKGENDKFLKITEKEIESVINHRSDMCVNLLTDYRNPYFGINKEKKKH